MGGVLPRRQPGGFRRRCVRVLVRRFEVAERGTAWLPRDAHPGLYRNAAALTQHPTRQLLAGVVYPRADQIMTRVAPIAALLGAFVIHRHAARIPAPRQASDHIA